MSLVAASNQFKYLPAPADKTPFNVIFTAAVGGSNVSQMVAFQPMPRLPAERDVFATTRPVPNAQSSDYIVRNVILSAAPESFNNQMRTTRSITISGKTVVFENGHPNALFNYSEADDIRAMEIHAETVIVRDALRLAQTAVTVYARELRFEDKAAVAPASIDTTPRSITIRPPQFQNGVDGLKAGSITLHVQSFNSASGYTPRFVQNGGTGQPAGLGQDGAAGTDMAVSGGLWGCPWPNNATYIQHLYGFNPVRVEKWGDFNNWPGDGGNATHGGKPGSGGDGGETYSITDVEDYLTCVPGTSGTKALTAFGGRAGTPNLAYRVELFESIGRNTILSQHSSQVGANAAAPEADKFLGLPGSYHPLVAQWSWFSPYALRQVFAHAKAAYLNGHPEAIELVLRDYVALVANYEGTGEWTSLPIEWQLDFRQMRDEMQALLYRMGNNLDIFGNPAGWVPMLSFEVNRAAFEAEINRAIRQLYLSYWVGNAAASVQGKVDALNYARTKLLEDIEGFKADYTVANDLLPGLETEALTLGNQVEYLGTRLEQLEQALLARAEHNVTEKHKVPGWKQALGVASAILKIVPTGRPVAGTIGQGLDLFTRIETQNPFKTYRELKDISKGLSDENLKKAAEDWKLQMDVIDLAAFKRGDIQGGVKNTINNLEPWRQPLEDGKAAIKSLLKKTEISGDEVSAE